MFMHVTELLLLFLLRLLSNGQRIYVKFNLCNKCRIELERNIFKTKRLLCYVQILLEMTTKEQDCFNTTLPFCIHACHVTYSQEAENVS